MSAPGVQVFGVVDWAPRTVAIYNERYLLAADSVGQREYADGVGWFFQGVDRFAGLVRQYEGEVS